MSDVTTLEAEALAVIGQGASYVVVCGDDEGQEYLDCLWVVTKWGLEGSPIPYDWNGKLFTFHPRAS